LIILVLFAFLAGIVTILSPCILPILPLILSGSIETGKSRPIGIVVGFIASFTFFTLALSTIVRSSGFDPDILRSVAVVLLFVFGLSMIIPKIQGLLELLFSKLSSLVPNTSQKTGLLGGLIIGASLGLLWAPCVGPILASVIALAATSAVSLQTTIVTLAYSLGTAIPLFAIMIGGQTLLSRVPFLVRNTMLIQRSFGVFMIITAIVIAFGYDRKFQTLVISVFPNYGAGLTKLEDNPAVQSELEKLKNAPKQERETSMLEQILKQDYGLAPELIGGTHWVNTTPLTIAGLRGKVVLIDFWTYTCINCIRTLPFVTGWYEKYKDQGLVVIGVHSPEFEFEKKTENVVMAMKDYGINYPVVQDNNFAIWRAYDNRYWPAKYFIDKEGHIRRTHFGEGDYEASEKFIQDLLAETGVTVAKGTLQLKEVKTQARTPETYLGYEREQLLESPETVKKDSPQQYTAPKEVSRSYFALSGTWTVGSEYAMPSINSSLLSTFEAKEVYLVMRPKDGTGGGRVRVLLDGKPAGESVAGDDVQESIVTVDQDRLYRLIKLGKTEIHSLKLEFLDGDIELYAFTFG